MNINSIVFFLSCLTFSLIGSNCAPLESSEPELHTNVFKLKCQFADKTAFDFSTSDVHFKPSIVASGPDTLLLEGEDANGNWIWVRLLHNDLSTLVPGTFPIAAIPELNKAEALFYIAGKSEELFFVNALEPNGSLTIESFNLSEKMIKAKFSCPAKSDKQSADLLNGEIDIDL